MTHVKTVEQYADAIMDMIESDMIDRPSMRAARNFSDLHDFVDANEYMIDAEVPYETGNESVMTFYVAVQDAVTARLARRA